MDGKTKELMETSLLADCFHTETEKNAKDTSTQSRSGLLSILPGRFVPYAELMRLGKPAGYWAFFLPHLFGSLHAAALNPAASTSLRLFSANALMLGGSLFLRGASCTWNDILDYKYDQQVRRCQNRPIARGAVSRTQAFVFMLGQTALGAGFFLLPLPHGCLAPAGLLITSQAVYPLFKRFTNYPQLWLGMSLGFGQLVGAAATGMDPISTAVAATRNHGLQATRAGTSLGLLYAAGVVNTIIYDTVYGHQDLADDLKAGVRSVAVAWKDHTKRNCGILVCLEASLLVLAGMASNYGAGYFNTAVGCTTSVIAILLHQVQLDVPESCMTCFNRMIALTGITLSVGLFSEYVEIDRLVSL